MGVIIFKLSMFIQEHLAFSGYSINGNSHSLMPWNNGKLTISWGNPGHHLTILVVRKVTWTLRCLPAHNSIPWSSWSKTDPFLDIGIVKEGRKKGLNIFFNSSHFWPLGRAISNFPIRPGSPCLPPEDMLRWGAPASLAYSALNLWIGRSCDYCLQPKWTDTCRRDWEALPIHI